MTGAGRQRAAPADRDAGEPDPRLRPRPLTVALTADHLLFCLGLFSLMPVLPVLLAALQRGSGATYVGSDLFVYTAAAGVGALGVTKWAERLPYAATVSGGLVLSGISFGTLPYVHYPPALLAVLLLAGLGYSIHFVFSRVLIAELISGDANRHRVNSVLQIAVNAAAAAGPFIAISLYASGHGRVLLTVVAACYLLAALTILARLPGRLFPPPTTTRFAISRTTITMVARDRLAAGVVIATAAGSFLYAQFYSAFALMAARQIASHPLRAVLLAVPAVAIVIAQGGVSWLVGRALNRRTHPFVILALATLVFGVAMLALGMGISVVADAFAGVLAFSVAEMLFTPTVSTAFATLPAASRLESFNLRQVSWTLGEAAGSWCGGSIFLFCLNRGDGRAYWLSLGTVALIGMSAVMVRVTRSRRAG